MTKTKPKTKTKPSREKPASRKPRIEYSPVLAEQVLDLIIDGRTLKEIEAMPGKPSRTVIFKWRKTHEEFAAQYDAAIDLRADGIADDTEEIARLMLAKKIDPAVGREVVATLKWAAGVRAPRRYGQKVSAELSGKDGGPIETRDVSPDRLLNLARSMALVLTNADQQLLPPSEDPE